MQILINQLHRIGHRR